MLSRMLERYDPRNWPISYEGLLHTGIVLKAAVVLALVVHFLVFAALRRFTKTSDSQIDDVIVERVRRPLRWAIIGFANDTPLATPTLLRTITKVFEDSR